MLHISMLAVQLFSALNDLFVLFYGLSVFKNMVRVKKSIDRFFHADHVFFHGEFASFRVNLINVRKPIR